MQKFEKKEQLKMYFGHLKVLSIRMKIFLLPIKITKKADEFITISVNAKIWKQ